MMLKMAPRAPIVKKHKLGRREKLVITVDGVLHDRLQEMYQDGVSISHVVDSALWHFFGQPKLSFQIDESVGDK
ncbi:MAG: hypothetical protein PHS86_03385 [Syntrophaceae bacterium]|nr:hypothetical protein [Syntrophaceae bacterium]